jgi:methylglyoxal synthase
MKPEKTIIGVLASRDDSEINRTVAKLFTYYFHHKDCERLERFHFVFTGGTYQRLFVADGSGPGLLSHRVAAWLQNKCGVTVLPKAREGGVTLLSNLIIKRQCSIVWPFYAAYEAHWLRPENLAFLRLCDQWHVKRLMNRGSVMLWFDRECEHDAERNLQPCPPECLLGPKKKWEPVGFGDPPPPHVTETEDSCTWTGRKKNYNHLTIALIAHDEMKSRMIEFAVDHEAELGRFNHILATGTTGREVAAATSPDINDKMHRYHSGPKGGDIEIATMILHDKCDVVIFFVDPLRPHPHLDDIRVVFQACMVKDQVVMITNEMHAREFMSRVVRGKDSLTVYPS